jgi:hypothetical protein
MENTLNCEKSINTSAYNKTNEKKFLLGDFSTKAKTICRFYSSYLIDWDLQGGNLNRREGERGSSSQSWSKIPT